MPIDAANIRILVDLDGSGVGPGAAAVVSQVGLMERGVRNAMTRVSTAFNSLSAGQKVLGGVGLGIGLLAAGMTQVIGPAIQFESAFAGVRKTVEGTPAQLASIRRGLLDMSNVMPTTASELASIAENAGQLGVAAPNVLAFTRSVAMLGETTDLDFDSAAQSLARFLNITGTGATGIGRIADVIVELGNNSATTESQIVNFSTRLASAFTVAGATEDQILGIASAFSSMGLRAEAGGSALSKIITSISDAAINGGNDLRVYAETAGLLPEKFAAIAAENPVEALVLFGEGLARLQAEGRSITPVLDALGLGGLRTSEAFRLLALNSDQVRAQLQLAADQFENGGAAAEEYGKRVETTAARIEIFRNRLNTLAIDLGTPLLDTFAAGVDAAGDAIVALADMLAPLGSALRDTFANGAELVSAFLAVVGPGAKVAVAALQGIVIGLTGMVTALNALGPAGLAIAILAADMALAGPIFRAAGVAATSLASSLIATGSGATAASVGVRSFMTSLITSPLVIAAAALAAIGFAFIDAGNDAEEAGNKFRDSLRDAFDSRNLTRIDNEIQQISSRMGELRDQIQETDDQSRGFLFDLIDDATFDVFKRTDELIIGISHALGFAEESTLHARRELDALSDVLSEAELGNFTEDIELTASALGITEEQVVRTADKLGILEGLVGANQAEFLSFVDAIDEATQGIQGAETASQALLTAMADGSQTLQQYTDILGLTEAQLRTLVDVTEGVDFGDLFDEDANVSASSYEAIVASLNGTISEMADALGITELAVLNQIGALDQLAAAHDRLSSAIDRARDAQAQLQFQQELLTAAQAQYDEALAAARQEQSTATLQGLAEATAELTFATAANASTTNEATAAQTRLAAGFIETGVSLGFPIEEVLRMAKAVLDIPPQRIVEIALEAGAFDGAMAEVLLQLTEAERERFIYLGIIDEAQPTIIGILELLRLFSEDPHVAGLAAADAGSLGLIAESSRQLEEFEKGATATLDARLGPDYPLLGASSDVVQRWAQTHTATLDVDADEANMGLQGATQNAIGFERVYRAALELKDDAAPVLEPVLGGLAEFIGGTWRNNIELIDDAGGVIEGLLGKLREFVLGPWKAIFDGDPEPAVQSAAVAASGGRDFAAGPYNAPLTATNTDAIEKITNSSSAARAFAAGGYNALLTATNTQSLAQTLGARAAAIGYSIARYNATLTATSAGAMIRIAATRLAATAYATTYTATLRVLDLASYRIRSALSLLNSFSGTRRATLTTVRRTVYSSSGGGSGGGRTYIADGGIVGYDNGGIADNLDGAVRERPGTAQIYSAATPFRVFAEPETGGEAYIPLAGSKRPQALRVWEETGRLLGVLANGGIQATVRLDGGQRTQQDAGGSAVQINAPIAVNIDVAGGAIDEQQVAVLVGRQIRTELAGVGRDLANMRA